MRFATARGPITLAKIRAFLSSELVPYFILGSVLGILISVVEIVLAGAIQAFLSSLGIMNVSPESRMADWIPSDNTLVAVSWFFGITFLRCAFQFAQIYTQNGTIEKFKSVLRLRILQWTFHSQSASSSRTVTLFSERTTNAASALGQVQALIVYAVTVSLIGVKLLFLSPVITAGLVVLSTPLFFVIKRLNRRAREAGQRYSEEWERTNHRLITVIKNLILVRIYDTQAKEESLAKESIRRYLSFAMRNIEIAATLFNIPQLLGVAVICVAAVVSTRYGLLAPGALLAYFYLFIRFVQGVGSFNQNMAGAMFYWPQLKEIYEWWENQYPESLAGLEKRRLQEKGLDANAPISGSLGWSFRDVQFAYPGSKPIFENFQLEVSPGRCVVIVGPSGMGKSTLLSLMLGELETTQGAVQVTVGEKRYPLSQVKSWILKHVGYVGPESFLVEGTVRDNLCYGLNHRPTNDKIERALTLAECQFLKELPNGLDHHLTEQGHGLSAGQKQRLSLARALLREPKALFLDEATSNLDYATESKLVETFKHLKQETTLVIVTHRDSLISLADTMLRL